MSHSSPVFVVGRFPPPLDGQTLATARTADLIGHEHTVQCLSTSVAETGGLVPTETRFRPDRALHYIRLRRTLSRALEAAPDAPVVWASVSPHPLGHARDVLTTLPTFGPSRPVIAVSHRAYFDRMFRSPLTRPTARRLVERVAAVVFLTPSLAERCAPWVPPDKRVVIPNTIGSDVLVSAEDATRRIELGRTDLPRLLFLGNMMPEKNYGAALAATRILHERGLPAQLDLVGRWISDADREAFEAEVARFGLAPYVRVHGAIADRARLRRLLLDADAMLFPSTHPSEALPLAVLEAMNAATPVVGVRHGGLPEVLRDESGGLLVEQPDPEALASAAERLLAPDRWVTFARQARARFESTFAPETVGGRWLALLDQTLDASRAPSPEPRTFL
ncbi:MAG: glycosyltransferase family 4 protein [Rhodothermaceae bacterium]|nr:glycosyltransferase family 4 protein [Rhodothermaceae bacterium]